MPTRAKYEADLAKTDTDIDRVQGKVIRWVNKLADLRAKRKRLVKNIKIMANNPEAEKASDKFLAAKKRKRTQSKDAKDQRFSNLDI